MRQEFEKLPEIKRKIISVNFNEKLNRYESKNPTLIECFETALYLNGALYAYQEQQRKYAELEAMYIQQGLNMFEQQRKIDAITDLMDEYYTGSFSTIEELAGEISALLTGMED